MNAHSANRRCGMEMKQHSKISRNISSTGFRLYQEKHFHGRVGRREIGIGQRVVAHRIQALLHRCFRFLLLTTEHCCTYGATVDARGRLLDRLPNL